MKAFFIVPKPQQMKLDSTYLDFDGIRLLSDKENVAIYLSCIPKGTVPTQFTCDCTLANEHYTISINAEGIFVKYGTPEGAFRACSTLKQIIAQADDGKIPCLEITDYPAIPKRGYLYDFSRGKVAKVDVLKRVIDILADLKYNELHLYVNRFGFQFKNFEKYWKDKSAFSAEEIQELDAYCKERFIRLVPNLNSFGHMEAFTEHEEFAHLAITDQDGKPSHTLNPLLDETLDFVDSIFDGFFDHFSSDVVHIGMDETTNLGMNETKEVCEKYGVGQVYTDFLNKVLKLIIEKYHKRPMFWADIVFLHPEQLQNIPNTSVVMDWGYESEYTFDRNCNTLKEKGLPFYVCPGTSMWNSYTGRSNNAAFNMHDAALNAQHYGAEGFLLTEWGDGGYPQFYATTYFPMVFGGSVAWNPWDSYVMTRSKIINDCKKYLDKYVFKIKGEGSMGDIIFRMGNYYLIEDSLYNNGTLCAKFFRRPDKYQPNAAEKKAFQRVIAYMEGLLQEMDAVEFDNAMREEITTNCNMVILFSKMLCDYSVTKEEVDALKTKFIELWNRENKTYRPIKESFTVALDKFYAAYIEKTSH